MCTNMTNLHKCVKISNYRLSFEGREEESVVEPTKQQIDMAQPDSQGQISHDDDILSGRAYKLLNIADERSQAM